MQISNAILIDLIIASSAFVVSSFVMGTVKSKVQSIILFRGLGLAFTARTAPALTHLSSDIKNITEHSI